MEKKIMVIEESLYEFAKRGRPKKGSKKSKESANKLRGIEAADAWEEPAEEDEDIDDVDIDVSDMANAEEISVEDSVFDDELFKVLNNEIKMLEINRSSLIFRLKGSPENILNGVPMAKIGDDAFLFKLEDGKMKKIKLTDIIIENQNKKNSRAKTINE